MSFVNLGLIGCFFVCFPAATPFDKAKRDDEDNERLPEDEE